MVETPEAIRVEIDQRREAISRDVDAIEQRAKSLTDWRQHVEERPLTVLAVAFGGGVLLGTMMGSSDSPRKAPSYDGDRDGRNGSSEFRAAGGHESSGDSALSEKIDMFRGALMGLAATKAEAYLRELLPGFADEVNKARKESSGSVGGQHVSPPRTPVQTMGNDEARFTPQSSLNVAGRIPDPAVDRPR